MIIHNRQSVRAAAAWHRFTSKASASRRLACSAAHLTITADPEHEIDGKFAASGALTPAQTVRSYGRNHLPP
jgi:hypothetical protein